MRYVLIFFAILSAVQLQAQDVAGSGTKVNEVSKDGFVFSWEVNDNLLTATMSAPGKGWVAVGFDPSAMMKDADIIIAYVDKGQVSIRDDYGNTPFSHKADTAGKGKDNIVSYSGDEQNGITTVTFTIPLDSGDKRDKVLVPGKRYKVIFAWNRSRDNFTSKHSYRSSFMVTL